MVLVVADTSFAQCTFNSAGKAKTIKASLVRAYAPCGSITFPAPNAQTETGTPSCAPPFAYSPFLLDDKKGKCDVKAKAKLERPCKDGSGDDCVNVKIQAKCKKLLQPDGVSAVTSSGWALQTIVRATFDDPIDGDMTVIDFPVSIDFGDAKNGNIKLKTDTNSILTELFGPATNLPDCAQLELVTFAVVDPDGDVFAKQGVGARP